MALSYVFFWNFKAPEDNLWHPIPGHGTAIYPATFPGFLRRVDLEAAVVDVAPFVAGAGGIAHLRQLNDFGLTARASIFANKLTMSALHRSAMYLTPLVLGLQAAGVEYRYCIPRWAHDREKRRDEEEVRKHVNTGLALGALSSITRSVFKIGPRWSLLDVVMGGALADLLFREYWKAHGL